MKKRSRTAKPRAQQGAVVAYQNASLPPAKRVKDLLSRMTMEEKAAQMMCVWQKKAEILVDVDGNFDLAKARKAFRNRRGLGQVGRPSDAGKGKGARAMAELTNAIQKFFLENTRLAIPVMFHEECLHGHAYHTRRHRARCLSARPKFSLRISLPARITAARSSAWGVEGLSSPFPIRVSG